MAKKSKYQHEEPELELEGEEYEQDSDDKVYELQQVPEIDYNLVTYTGHWNETFKSFDLLKLYVNGSSGQTKTEYIRTRFTHDYQIHAEVLKRLQDDFIKKGRNK